MGPEAGAQDNIGVEIVFASPIETANEQPDAGPIIASTRASSPNVPVAGMTLQASIDDHG